MNFALIDFHQLDPSPLFQIAGPASDFKCINQIGKRSTQSSGLIVFFENLGSPKPTCMGYIKSKITFDSLRSIRLSNWT